MKRINKKMNKFIFILFTLVLQGCNKVNDIYNVEKYKNNISSGIIPGADFFFYNLDDFDRLINSSYGIGSIYARKDWVELPAPFDSVRAFYGDNLAEYGYVAGTAAQQWTLPPGWLRSPPKRVAAYVRDVPAGGTGVHRSVIVIAYEPPTPATRSWEPTDTYYLVIVSDGILSAERARALPP